MRIIAGLLTFLFGMNLMSSKLQKLEHMRIKRWLNALSGRPLFCVFVGTACAFLIQSSSTVVLVIIGLIGGNMIGLPTAFMLLLGCNLGTSFYQPFLGRAVYTISVAVGVFAFFWWIVSPRRDHKNIAQALLGTAFIFIGLDQMKLGLYGITETAWFTESMRMMHKGGTSFMQGLAFTTIMQSSRLSLTTLFSFVQNQAVPLLSAIYFMMGANIATTSTGILTTLQSGVEQKRAALLHLMINACGAMILLPALWGWSRFGSFDTLPLSTSQVFWGAHIAFNLFSVVLFFPLRKYFLQFAAIIVPAEGESERMRGSLAYEAENSTVSLKRLHTEMQAHHRLMWSYGKLVFQVFTIQEPAMAERAMQTAIYIEEGRVKLNDRYYRSVENAKTMGISEDLVSLYLQMVQMQQLHNYMQQLFSIAVDRSTRKADQDELLQISFHRTFADTLDFLYLCTQEMAPSQSERAYAITRAENHETLFPLYMRSLMTAVSEGELGRQSADELARVSERLMHINRIALHQMDDLAHGEVDAWRESVSLHTQQ